MLTLEAAGELLELITDVEGDADEELLDECLEALRDLKRIPVAPVGFVAVGFPQAEIAVVVTLVERDVVADPIELANAEARLRDALRQAHR